MTPSKEKEVDGNLTADIVPTRTRQAQRVYDILSNLTHYSRSKFSRDCSRNETEEEMSTEMLVASEVESLMLSELSRVEKETENRVWREAGEIAKTNTMSDFDRVQTGCDNKSYLKAGKDISSTLLSQVKE